MKPSIRWLFAYVGLSMDTLNLNTDDLKEIGLAYVHDGMKGIKRLKNENGFHYEFEDGVEITDEKNLIRIKKLVIPPAWQNVWISNKANGYLQATGIDAKGRKQYRYHADWSKNRGEKKFEKLYAFGKVLPTVREKIEADLKGQTLTKTRILALLIEIIDETLIRVGNRAYMKANKSFGLTTLMNKHLKEDGSKLVLDFIGKKGYINLFR